MKEYRKEIRIPNTINSSHHRCFTLTQHRIFMIIMAELQDVMDEYLFKKLFIHNYNPNKLSIFKAPQYKDTITGTDSVLLHLDLKDMCRPSQYRTFKKAFTDFASCPIEIPDMGNNIYTKFNQLWTAILPLKYKTKMAILIEKEMVLRLLGTK